MGTIPRVLLAIGFLLGLTGCSPGSDEAASSCTFFEMNVPSVVLKVYDKRTQLPLDGAAAEFQRSPQLLDASRPELVLPGESYRATSGGESVIYGPRDRPGAYAITVTRLGYQRWTRGAIEVAYRDCALQTAIVDVELVPTENAP
jgi:hypothetical protein